MAGSFINTIFGGVETKFLNFPLPSEGQSYLSYLWSPTSIPKEKINALVLDKNSSIYKSEIRELFDTLLNNHQWKKLFEDSEELLNDIKKLHMIPHKGLAIKARVDFFKKVEKMVVERDRLLLPATTQPDVNIFYLIEKKEGTYNLTIIGCDKWMPAITGDRIGMEDGRERIQCQKEFHKIPRSLLEPELIKTLFSLPLIEGCFNSQAVKSELEKFDQYTAQIVEKLVIPKASPRKLYALLVARFDMGPRKILQFKTKLLAFFQNYRSIDDDSLIREIIREIAREAAILSQKKTISCVALAEIHTELEYIEKNLKTEIPESELVFNDQGVEALSSINLSYTPPTAIKEKVVEGVLRDPQSLPNYSEVKTEGLLHEILHMKQEWWQWTAEEAIGGIHNIVKLSTEYSHKNRIINPIDILVMCKLSLMAAAIRNSFFGPKKMGIDLILYPLWDFHDDLKEMLNMQSLHFYGEIKDQYGRYFKSYRQKRIFCTLSREVMQLMEYVQNPDKRERTKDYFDSQWTTAKQLLSRQKTLLEPYLEALERPWKSKQIKNRYLHAALFSMEVTGVIPNVMKKIYEEKRVGDYTTNSGTLSISFPDGIPEYSGSMWQKTSEEEKEMQKECDRSESLKLPEAISDDPKRVFQQQLMKFNDDLEYTKEELSDLLSLLRQKYPQIEAIRFIVKHPHLLSHSDIRHYLDVVLFDIGGCTILQTLKDNEDFAKNLPMILLKELIKYRTLGRKKEFLYIVSVMRRLDEIADVGGINWDSLTEFKDDPRFKFERVMSLLKTETVKDVAQVVILYHQLPEEIKEVDPGDLAILDHRYLALLDKIKDENLEPLLDHICQSLQMPLHGAWSGKFPNYTNGVYEIDLSKRGAFMTTLPAYLLQNPLCKMAYGDVNRVKLMKWGIYQIPGKGQIENNRFYRIKNGKTYIIRAPVGDLLKLLAPDGLYFSSSREATVFDGESSFTISFSWWQQGVHTINGYQSLGECKVRTAHRLRVEHFSFFEHSKRTIFLCDNYRMEWNYLSFPRYKLTFENKRDKWFSKDPNNEGYYIDLATRDKLGFSRSILLKHTDETRDAKLIISDGERAYTYLINCETGHFISESIDHAIFLMKAALAEEKPHLALKFLKTMALRQKDLTKKRLKNFYQFLYGSKSTTAESHAFKLQLALHLWILMGELQKYKLVREQLKDALKGHFEGYLSYGRKIDSRLQISRLQRQEIDYILSGRGYFLRDKDDGWYGFERMPLADLEKSLRPYKFSRPKIHQIKGKPILYKKGVLTEPSNVMLPKVDLKVPDNCPENERAGVQRLIDEMSVYRDQVKGKKNYYLVYGISEKLEEKKKELSRKIKQAKKDLKQLLCNCYDTGKVMKVKGRLQHLPTIHELTLQYLQDGNLMEPIGLENALKEYYQLQIQYNIVVTAHKMADEGVNCHDILTTERKYDIERHPELLIFEYLSRKALRQMNASTHQIEFLEKIMKKPCGIHQAPTGAGKTSVFAILQALMETNGTNLLTLRIQSTLYQQSLSLFEQQLGKKGFDRYVHPFIFNLQMPLAIKEGKEVISLFQKIYQDFLVTIKEKGCVITDYKSLPLLQEKWIKLNREFLAIQRDGGIIPSLEKEHWHYLKKILTLLEEREETHMDEFDVPNRSCNRLQIPMGKTVTLPKFMIEDSLAIYEHLICTALDLESDWQHKCSDDKKKEVLERAAKEVVRQFLVSDQKLFDFFFGKNENIWDEKLTDEEKDRITFFKDQFYTFLPHSLGKACGLDYKRSKNGKRIIPCPNGEPHENSRWGHPLEEINFTIQDYIYNGVHRLELKEWIEKLQQGKLKYPTSSIYQKNYEEIFPGRKLPDGDIENLDELLEIVNQSWKTKRPFLLEKLSSITVSGSVISMTPHDMAPERTSGMSATVGCPEELPAPFDAENFKPSGIVGEMAYRFINRTNVDKNAHPNAEYSAIIDGAGDFRSQSPKEVAKKLLSPYSYVGYHDAENKIRRIGNSYAWQKKFYYRMDKTRGTDIKLERDAQAFMTVDEKRVTLEKLLQDSGRMREVMQGIDIPSTKTAEELLVLSARNEGKSQSPGLYQGKMQEPRHLVRKEGLKKLLKCKTLEETLDAFKPFIPLFISDSPHEYWYPGQYFQRNRAIKRNDLTPSESLTQQKERNLELAKELGLVTEKLEKLTWSPEVLAKMPPFVSGRDDMGLEVEEEVEVECEVEQEVCIEVEEEEEKEQQFDQCGDVPYYPPRKNEGYGIYSAQRLHRAFDPRIRFTENFLPLERKDQLFKRQPFDRAMPKVTVVAIQRGVDKVEDIIVGDMLDSVFPHGRFPPLFDLETRTFIAHKGFSRIEQGDDFHLLLAQLRFMNGEVDGYTDRELEQLKKWVTWHDLKGFFVNVILKHRPRQRALLKKSSLF